MPRGAASVEVGADGEIRTLTDEDLNLVPLPLGYVGDRLRIEIERMDQG